MKAKQATKARAARIGLRIPADLRKRLEADARKEYLTVSDTVRRIVLRHYGQVGER